eukprot:6610330-Karenia_brevis.AAC.1
MARHMEEAGLAPAEVVLRAYDDRTEGAIARLQDAVSQSVWERISSAVEDARTAAEERWRW